MEVRPAEAERREPGAADAARRLLPLAQLGVHVEGRPGPVEVGVRLLEVEARGNDLRREGQRRLQEARRARAGLQVADVRLDRSERNGVDREAGRAERLDEALHLDDVADLRRRAVPLDEGAGRRVEARGRPAVPEREALADRVRGGDPLAAPVARAADAPDDGVDPVAVALGVGEPLEEEERRPLAHDEAVGPVGVGARPGGRERADLAELHEARRAHVPVEAAGEDGVEVARDEAVDGRAHRREGGGAGGVGDVVGAVEVEEVRDPPGDAVRQLARHRVLGDRGKAPVDPLAELGEGAGALGGREGREVGRLLQVGLELGVRDVVRGLVVLLAPHRVSEDDRRPVEVEGPRGPAVVGERLARDRDRPLLPLVHPRLDERRDRELPLHRLPRELADPAADLRVGLQRRLRVGVVVERGVPALRVDLGDSVDPLRHVLPEGGGGGGAGHDRADADDGDGAVGRVIHGVVLFSQARGAGVRP